MKILRNNEAISQIIGEIVLLAIAVTAVSVIAIQVLSTPGPQDIREVTIIGKIEGGFPTFDLQRGEPLGPDSKIDLKIFGKTEKYSLEDFIGNNMWNIGDRFTDDTYVLDDDPEKSYQVEATIIDTKTNAIVFWGILQGGLTTGHNGGIWHLNESFWSSIRYDVNDSSGNKNHGIAKNSPTIIDWTKPEQRQNTINNNSGYFNQFNNSYIRVNSSLTLNITKNITIEAWMKPENLSAVVTCLKTEYQFGMTPWFISVKDNIYATITEDNVGAKGTLITYKISPNGNIEKIDSYNPIGNAKDKYGLLPVVTKISDNIFLVSYNTKIGSREHFCLETFRIVEGYIEPTGFPVVDICETPAEENRVSILRINDTTCAIAYRVESEGGIIKTLNISLDGEIFESSGDTYQYDSAGYDPFLIHVTKTVYAIAYRNASKFGNLTTFNITSSASINFSHSKTVRFDNLSGYEPWVTQVSGKIFAVVYRADQITDNAHGYVKTFNILSNSSIVWTHNMFTFEKTRSCYNPCIAHGDDDYYVVAYSTGNNVENNKNIGLYTTFRIGQNGLITPITGTQKQFYGINPKNNQPLDLCINPIIVKINENVFSICYTTQGHEGVIITIVIGMETYAPYRGITKRDSYGIYVETNNITKKSKVVGSINNVMVNATISAGWHYIAVTYDGEYIRLYINDSQEVKLSGFYYYPNHQINRRSWDLYFGHYYNGYIDEIAIYDRCLTQPQLQNHFENPGTYNITDI